MALYDSYFNAVTLDDLNALLQDSGCPTIAPGAAPPPSPATLAQQVWDSFELPDPSGHRSPLESLEYQGLPFTYVGLYTWFWTDPGTWQPLSARADAGGNWAAVTATPVSLTFDPGDGSDPAVCQGPGRAWVDSDGNGPPTGSGCAFEYLRVTTAPITATETITWRMTWTGSGDTSGTLATKATSAPGQLQVLQIQTVTVNR